MMTKKLIHIYGASGAGTTTLGRYIATETSAVHLDTDDFFWLPTDPPFNTKRSKEDRLTLLAEALDKADFAVLSGSLSGWGDIFIPRFTLAIRLYTEQNLRLQRLRNRERQRFGDRLDGDMAEGHQAFLNWAASYDTGDVDMRSAAMHDVWEKKLSCPLLRLNGSAPLVENFEKIRLYL